MRVEVYEALDKFCVDVDAKYEPRRPRPKLRFGLKVKGKEGKKKTNTRQTKTRLKLSRQPQEKPVIKPSGKRRRQEVSEPEVSESSCDANADESESEPSCSEAIGDGERDDKEIIPVTHDMTQEEANAQKLEQEHENVKEAAVKSAESRGTFFSKEVGVDDVGMAVSARSKCYFCGEKIAKDTVRFSFHHSTLRPSNWVHAKCLVPLVQRDNCTQQGKARLAILRDKLTQASGSHSSGSAQAPTSVVLLGAVTQALNELA